MRARFISERQADFENYAGPHFPREGPPVPARGELERAVYLNRTNRFDQREACEALYELGSRLRIEQHPIAKRETRVGLKHGFDFRFACGPLALRCSPAPRR